MLEKRLSPRNPYTILATGDLIASGMKRRDLTSLLAVLIITLISSNVAFCISCCETDSAVVLKSVISSGARSMLQYIEKFLKVEDWGKNLRIFTGTCIWILPLKNSVAFIWEWNIRASTRDETDTP